jgi:hypothetical protein
MKIVPENGSCRICSPTRAARLSAGLITFLFFLYFEPGVWPASGLLKFNLNRVSIRTSQRYYTLSRAKTHGEPACEAAGVRCGPRPRVGHAPRAEWGLRGHGSPDWPKVVLRASSAAPGSFDSPCEQQRFGSARTLRDAQNRAVADTARLALFFVAGT